MKTVLQIDLVDSQMPTGRDFLIFVSTQIVFTIFIQLMFMEQKDSFLCI